VASVLDQTKEMKMKSFGSDSTPTASERARRRADGENIISFCLDEFFFGEMLGSPSLWLNG
jgi:hypothetical protein